MASRRTSIPTAPVCPSIPGAAKLIGRRQVNLKETRLRPQLPDDAAWRNLFCLGIVKFFVLAAHLIPGQTVCRTHITLEDELPVVVTRQKLDLLLRQLENPDIERLGESHFSIAQHRICSGVNTTKHDLCRLVFIAPTAFWNGIEIRNGIALSIRAAGDVNDSIYAIRVRRRTCSNIFPAKHQRDAEPVLHPFPALCICRNVDRFEFSAVLK